MKLISLFAVFLFYLLVTCDVPHTKEAKEPTAETENPRDKTKHQSEITALQLKNIRLKNTIIKYRFKDQTSWLAFRNKMSEELAQKEKNLKLLQNNLD